MISFFRGILLLWIFFCGISVANEGADWSRLDVLENSLEKYVEEGRLAGGGAAFGAASNPALLAALPFTSPRLVGEGALAAGDGVRMSGNALSAAQQRISDLPDYRNLSVDAGLRYAADSATSQPVADARRLRTAGVLDRAATEESESDARIRQLLNIPQSALIQQ
jgi:hypothetical protein